MFYAARISTATFFNWKAKFGGDTRKHVDTLRGGEIDSRGIEPAIRKG